MDWQVVNLINDFDPGVHNTQHYENSWHIPVSGNPDFDNKRKS